MEKSELRIKMDRTENVASFRYHESKFPSRATIKFLFTFAGGKIFKILGYTYLVREFFTSSFNFVFTFENLFVPQIYLIIQKDARRQFCCWLGQHQHSYLYSRSVLHINQADHWTSMAGSFSWTLFLAEQAAILSCTIWENQMNKRLDKLTDYLSLYWIIHATLCG